MAAKNMTMNGNAEEIFDQSEGELIDSQLPLACCESRHSGPIEGLDPCLQCWRSKDRVRFI